MTTVSSQPSDDALEQFEICFNDSVAVFTSGDEITGRLLISLCRPMKMRMVQLQFKGSTSLFSANACQTAQGPAGVNVDVGSTHGAPKVMHQIVHLDTTLDLLERRPGQEVPHDFELPQGANWLPFSFPLPHKAMPASLESPGASVRYWCRAVILKPWHHDQVAKRAFTVLPPCAASEQLNAKDGFYDCRIVTEDSFPLFWRPVTKNETAITKSCCFAGKVACEVASPRQVYNLGDKLNFSAKLNSSGPRPVERANFRLLQLVLCRTVETVDLKPEVRMTTYARTVYEQDVQNPCGGKAGDAWSGDFGFAVPALCPTMEMDDQGVLLLRVAYQLRVQLKVSKKTGANALLEMRLPLALVGAPYITRTQSLKRDAADASAFRFEPCHFGACSIVERDDEQRCLLSSPPFTPLYPVM